MKWRRFAFNNSTTSRPPSSTPPFLFHGRHHTCIRSERQIGGARMIQRNMLKMRTYDEALRNIPEHGRQAAVRALVLSLASAQCVPEPGPGVTITTYRTRLQESRRCMHSTLLPYPRSLHRHVTPLVSTSPRKVHGEGKVGLQLACSNKHATYCSARVVIPHNINPHGEAHMDGGCPLTGISTSAITAR